MDKYSEILRRFEARRDEATAAKKSAYMRNLFIFFGMAAPQRREATADIIAADKATGIVDWDFLDRCLEDDRREFQYLVADYLIAMQKHITYEDVAAHIERYIRTKQWWDSIDALDIVIGRIAFTDQRIDGLMLRWSTDPDFWVRRVAIDHQLCRKERTDTLLMEQILVNNFGSKEFFINKAIGWALRDYSKTNPAWVRDFIRRYRTQLAPLSIREASKYI